MARPTNNRKSGRVQVQTADTRPGVGVYQGIGGLAAPSSSANAAQGLAQALGLAAGVATEVKKANDQVYLQQGQYDAQQGNINQEQYDASEAYKTGALTVKSRADFLEHQRALEEAYQEQFDKTSSLDDLNDFINGFYAERYEGLDDPVIAQAVLPMMSATRTDLLNKHAELQKREVNAEILNSFSELAFDELAKTGTLDVQSLHDQMMPVVGGSQANAMLATIVSQAAVEQANPDLLNILPKKWADGTPGLTDIPGYRDKLKEARNSAEQARLERMSFTRVATLKDASLIADKGQFNGKHAKTLLDIGVAEGTVYGLWARSQSALYGAETKGVRTSYILKGAGHLLDKKDAQDAIDTIYAEAEERGLGQQDIIRLASANSMLPTAHKRLLEATSPMANPRVFNEAANLYAEYSAQERNFAATAIPEEKAALYEAYLTLTQDGEQSPEQALQFLNGVDFSQGKNILAGTSGRQLREKYDDVFDRFGWWNDIKDTPVARRKINNMARMLHGYGLDEKAAIEKSLEWFNGRYTVVDGTAFRSELVPEDHEDMLEWFKEQKLGEEAEEWAIREDFTSDRQGGFVLVNTGENPLFSNPDQHYTWEQVSQLWNGERDKRSMAELEERSKEKRAELRELARSRVRNRLRKETPLGLGAEEDAGVLDLLGAASIGGKGTAFDPLGRLPKAEQDELIKQELKEIQKEQELEVRKRSEMFKSRLRGRAISELSGGVSASGLKPASTPAFLEWINLSEDEQEKRIEAKMDELLKQETKVRQKLLERITGE